MTEPQQQRPRNPWNILVGNVLQSWRRVHLPDLTQEQMAAVLDVHRSQVSQIETGKRALTLRESILLKQAYGVSMEALLGGFGQVGGDVLALLENLPERDQQEIYELFCRAIVLLAARRQQQQPPEGPAQQG